MEAGNIKEEDNPLFKKLRKLISLVVRKILNLKKIKLGSIERCRFTTIHKSS